MRQSHNEEAPSHGNMSGKIRVSSGLHRMHQVTITHASLRHARKKTHICMHEQRERDSPCTGWRQVQMSSAHRAARGISAACGHPHRAGAYTAARKPLICGTQAKRGPCDRGVCAYPSPRPRGGAIGVRSCPSRVSAPHRKRHACQARPVHAKRGLYPML